MAECEHEWVVDIYTYKGRVIKFCKKCELKIDICTKDDFDILEKYITDYMYKNYKRDAKEDMAKKIKDSLNWILQ